MASLLRQIVAGPRSRHPEAGLDLCYVTDEIIATSGPSSTYPQRAYRNPTDALVKFLDYKHQDKWAIWEFRAEGTGYPDAEVYGRIWHYPWPDHHPPPFALIPNIMASMRNWLQGDKDRMVVVHCKAGKGRSGTMACSYLISECDWEPAEALARFTERRMRAGFGQGVSIPSQLRWVGYVDRWTKHGKIYVERQVEILEVHVWGLRDGVKVAVEGYIEEGRKIKNFHVFKRDERMVVDDSTSSNSDLSSAAHVFNGKKKSSGSSTPLHSNSAPAQSSETSSIDTSKSSNLPQKSSHTTASMIESRLSPAIHKIKDPSDQTGLERGGGAVIFRSAHPLILPTSDINIDFERRNKASYGGWTMVTSVAHVWFNAFFEGQGPESDGNAAESGIFEIEWDKMDGIKGSARKGTRAFDKLAVVWRAVEDTSVESKGEPTAPGTKRRGTLIREPSTEEEVKQMPAADWAGANDEQPEAMHKDLGLRVESPATADVSKASSLHSAVSDASSSKLRDVSKSEPTSPPDSDPGDEHLASPNELPRVRADATEPSPQQAKDGLDTATRTTSVTTETGDSGATGHLASSASSPALPLGKENNQLPEQPETLGSILEGVKSISTSDLPEGSKK
ncbi:MAG: hypothetical protein M4579_000683 [Chaenotheca gracillima]|nr:MAG: hypothetical protein M4579_000683 [Chaenotheca gracillima]